MFFKKQGGSGSGVGNLALVWSLGCLGFLIALVRVLQRNRCDFYRIIQLPGAMLRTTDRDLTETEAHRVN